MGRIRANDLDRAIEAMLEQVTKVEVAAGKQGIEYDMSGIRQWALDLYLAGCKLLGREGELHQVFSAEDGDTDKVVAAEEPDKSNGTNIVALRGGLEDVIGGILTEGKKPKAPLSTAISSLRSSAESLFVQIVRNQGAMERLRSSFEIEEALRARGGRTEAPSVEDLTSDQIADVITFIAKADDGYTGGRTDQIILLAAQYYLTEYGIDEIYQVQVEGLINDLLDVNINWLQLQFIHSEKEQDIERTDDGAAEHDMNTKYKLTEQGQRRVGVIVNRFFSLNSSLGSQPNL